MRTINQRTRLLYPPLKVPTKAIGAALVPLLLAGCGGNDDPTEPAAVALPSSCSSLATEVRWGLAGNPVITKVTATQIPAQAPNSIGTPATPGSPGSSLDPNGAAESAKRFPPTPTFCQVDINVSNSADTGYAPGEKQSINIRIALPEKANWKDRLMVQGGSGSQGTIEQTGSFGEGANYEAYLYYAIRLGMVGTTTDAGHTTAENSQFAVIQATNSLNLGKITDWRERATFYAMRWSKTIARTYYGKDVKYTYYNGGSGGGYQGMGQLQQHADEYNGFLIGTPANYYTQLQLATPWPGLVIRDTLTTKGKTLTAAQLNAARSSAIAACDGGDGVVDGLVADPRICTFDATSNMCGVAGAPVSPACLDADQAAAINRIWDGPRNKIGQKIWFGWDRTEPIGPFQTDWGTNPLAAAVYKWTKLDLNFDMASVYLDAATRAAAGNPAGSTVFEDIATLGSNVLSDQIDNANPALTVARDKGVKVIQTVGNYDKSIFWRQSVKYYRSVAERLGNGVVDYTALQSWYRLFIMPGQGDGTFHTIAPDATGPGALDPFLVLVGWVEGGQAPASILAGSGSVAGRTRPLCPYPQWAQYKGTGSINSADSFACGGNLETASSVMQDVLAPFKRENGN